ncbi:hypothetical protein MD484_g5239, partial [Candolleomyces efflorescens]
MRTKTTKKKKKKERRMRRKKKKKKKKKKKRLALSLTQSLQSQSVPQLSVRTVAALSQTPWRAACYLYSEGQSRGPEMLIVLVLPPVSSPPPNRAALMEQIYAEDPMQFDWDSDIGKLFYKFRPSAGALPPLFQRTGKKCLVELLLSGSGGLPLLLPSDIAKLEELPVIPFLSLLLAMLEKWDNYPRRANADELQLLLTHVPHLPAQFFRPWRERDFMSEDFQARSELRARKFSQAFPDTEYIWQMLGFLALPPSPLNEYGNVEIPKSSSDRPHTPVTDVAARRVVAILDELGFACALSGSAAFQLYTHGGTRVSERLEIIVLPPHSFEHDEVWLQEQIVQEDPTQFTRNLVKGTLLFKFPPEVILPRSYQVKNKRTCIVDLVLPGTPGVPRLLTCDVVWIDDLPVIPFLTALLLLLERWDDIHYKRDNLRDLKRLLVLVPDLPVSVFRPWRERRCMSEAYQARSEERAAGFARGTLTGPIWEMLGFEVVR